MRVYSVRRGGGGDMHPCTSLLPPPLILGSLPSRLAPCALLLLGEWLTLLLLMGLHELLHELLLLLLLLLHGLPHVRDLRAAACGAGAVATCLAVGALPVATASAPAAAARLAAFLGRRGAWALGGVREAVKAARTPRQHDAGEDVAEVRAAVAAHQRAGRRRVT